MCSHKHRCIYVKWSVELSDVTKIELDRNILIDVSSIKFHLMYFADFVGFYAFIWMDRLTNGGAVRF
jgi:hypothetical protein